MRASGKNAKPAKHPSKKPPAALLFWLSFSVVIIFIFFINIPKIKETLESTRFLDRLLNRPAETTAAPPAEPSIFNRQSSGEGGYGGSGLLPFDPAFPFGTDDPAELQQHLLGENSGGFLNPDDGALSETFTFTDAAPSVASANEGAAPNTRERTLYFVNIDSSGMVFLSPVKRELPSTQAPLSAAITSLLSGLSREEEAAGTSTLIPSGVKLLGARVQGHTAYLNFNENFLFNNYDAEGYYGQLRQIVWTATEFPNVRNIQILIENRKVEYLGLTIKIDRPLGRESL
ncbi:MAG: GerMN domain-containing protein [Spirochaetaceae bacterium]|jgi:hypothetical protein|nr:GerMN domain-containing protein [Spirochaetaceae bacterium]